MADSPTKRDQWLKSVVNDAAWYTDSARSAGGSAVYIGSYITVLIPFHDEYMPYLQWRDNVEGHYTMSTSDYIVHGEVPEEITVSNIQDVLEKYGENVCLVRHHNENYKRFGSRVQLKVEGV